MRRSQTRGALLASLYALTRSAVRVRTLLWELDFSTFRNVDVGVLLNFYNTWGMDDGSAMIRALETLLDATGEKCGACASRTGEPRKVANE